ncbi:MAG TPA: cupredoxin domain-containing protein [Chloroflexota bacterium]|jgi:nitrite reductase (NO-forming)
MRRFASLVVAAAAVGLVITAAACGSATPASDNPPASSTPMSAPAAPNGMQAVTLSVGSNMSFEPSSFNVHAGQPVQLTLQNTGDNAHDFTLGEGVSQPVKITATAGQSATATFTIDTPGSYSFDCSMPGHALLGMRGTITVQ